MGNKLVKWLVKIREFNKEPDLHAADIKDLAYIWLYTTCMYEQLLVDPILSDENWDKLTNYLKDNHSSLDAAMRWALPISALKKRRAGDVNWWGGIGALVMFDCEIYSKIRKGKRSGKAA